MNLIKLFFRDDSGSSALEYALIASCVSAGAISGIDFATNLTAAPLRQAHTSITIEVDEDKRAVLTREDAIELSMKALGFNTSN